MNLTKMILTLTAVVLLASTPLLAQGHFPNFQPGQGNPGAFFSQNPQFLEQIKEQMQSLCGEGGFAGFQDFNGLDGLAGIGTGAGLTGFLLQEYIGLTDDQKAILAEARKAGREAMRENTKELMEIRRQIASAVQDNQPVDPALIDRQIALTGAMIRSRVAQQSETMARLNLTPEQKEKLAKLREHSNSFKNRFRGHFGENPPPANP